MIEQHNKSKTKSHKQQHKANINKQQIQQTQTTQNKNTCKTTNNNQEQQKKQTKLIKYTNQTKHDINKHIKQEYMKK